MMIRSKQTDSQTTETLIARILREQFLSACYMGIKTIHGIEDFKLSVFFNKMLCINWLFYCCL